MILVAQTVKIKKKMCLTHMETFLFATQSIKVIKTLEYREFASMSKLVSK